MILGGLARCLLRVAELASWEWWQKLLVELGNLQERSVPVEQQARQIRLVQQ